MKMLMKNVLKFSAGILCASVLASQAFAEDIALAGSYGNYLKAGCGWSLSSSNYYGPTSGVPYGATTNGVKVDIYYLQCSGNSAPQAVKVNQSNITFIYPNIYGGWVTSQSCSMNPGQASVQGDCTNYRVYK